MQKYTNTHHESRFWKPFSKYTDSIWLFIILISAFIIGILVFGQIQSGLRPIFAFWFLLVCPGMSFIKLLDIQEPLYEWSLAIALSLSLDSLVAGVFIYAGHWNPPEILGVIILLSIVGVLLQINRQNKKR